MAKANPLRKITAEAKRIRKLHPNKHRNWTGFVKEAGEKYRKGKIGTTRKKKSVKRKVAKVGAPKKKATRKRKRSAVRRSKPKTVTQVVTVRRRTRYVGKRVAVPKRRRIAGQGLTLKKILPWVIVGGAAYLLWKTYKDKEGQQPTTNQPPPLVTTTNPVRNQQSQDLVNYAIAGGLAVDAIIKLINSLNKKGDAEVNNLFNSVSAGQGLPSSLFV